MVKKLKIINGRIITPEKIIEKGSLLISDGIITEISDKEILTKTDITVDAEENFISPGFIDIHVHGGGGSDFMDGTIGDFLTIAETHLKYGTTALVPTTLSAGKENLLHILDTYRKASQENVKGAQFLGMHIEGPYFAMSQKGAQDPRYIRKPDKNEYSEIIKKTGDIIVRWSAAPELEGAIDFGKYLKAHDILPALSVVGTRAVVPYFKCVSAMVRKSPMVLATHFYSAMSGVTRRNAFRYAGVIESVYLIDEIDVEIIADGVHLPAPLLKLIYKIKGPGRIALITDAMRAAGMRNGESILGSRENGLKVIVEDGVAKLPDRSSFAGSVATTNRLVRTMIQIAGVPVIEAVRMMTLTPARIMKIDKHKGSITAGKDGDMLIFDKDINIQTAIVKGEVLYNKS
jgi:N-acetylglucosamine-6-phosphate deacetylase